MDISPIGQLCTPDLDNIRGWSPVNLPLGEEEKLAPAGQDEWFNVGERYKARLPGLLDRTYNEDDFTVIFFLMHTFKVTH